LSISLNVELDGSTANMSRRSELYQSRARLVQDVELS
jgi:hypothetical protein